MKMASTLLLAMLMLFGSRMGEAKLDCDYDRIKPIEYLDLSKASKPYYLVYVDHTPPFLQKGSLTYFDLDTKSKPGLLRYNFVHVGENNHCEEQKGESLPSGNNTELTSELFGLTQRVHVLATDYSTSASVFEFLNDQGKRIEELSYLAIGVDDPRKPPNMDVVKDALKYTCGPDAGDLRYYRKLVTNPDAGCMVVGSFKPLTQYVHH